MLPCNALQDQTELINYEAVRIKYYECVYVCECVYSCLSYPACKSHLFCAVLYCQLAACVAVQYFPTLSHKHRFSEKVIEQNVCFDCLYNFCLTHCSL